MTTINKKKVFYSVPDHDPETRFETSTVFDPVAEPIYLSSIARDCAQDYHDGHDGWEDTWPLEFALYDSKEGGTELGRFIVDRESVPHFTVSRKKT